MPTQSKLPLPDAGAVRAHLVDALQAGLVGPYHGDHDEVLDVPPSRWYLTGFLAPDGARVDEDQNDALDAGSDVMEEDTGGSDPAAKPKRFFPASIGMTVMLPGPIGADHAVKLTVRYADYTAERPGPTDDDAAESGIPPASRSYHFRRRPRPPIALDIPLEPSALLHTHPTTRTPTTARRVRTGARSF